MNRVMEETYVISEEEQKLLQYVVILEILDRQHSITYKVSNMTKVNVRRYLEVWDGRISGLEYLQRIGAQINILFNDGDSGYSFSDLAMVAERADKIMAEQYGINYGGLSPAYKRNRRKNHRDVSPRNYYLKTYEDALRTVRSYGDLQTNIPMELHSYSQLVEQINIIYREHCSVV